MSAEPLRKARAPISPALLGTLRDCADTLDQALSLKVGMMDSQSRVEAVMREQRELVTRVAATLRALA
jgi:hypothetical protein